MDQRSLPPLAQNESGSSAATLHGPYVLITHRSISTESTKPSSTLDDESAIRAEVERAWREVSQNWAADDGRHSQHSLPSDSLPSLKSDTTVESQDDFKRGDTAKRYSGAEAGIFSVTRMEQRGGKCYYTFFEVSGRPRDTEEIKHYCKGGFMPVHLGDMFRQRFEIVGKLGSGSYGVVWRARDQPTGQYVALKVGSAINSKCSGFEIDALTTLSQNGKARGRLWTPAFLDESRVESPNGSHPCLITEELPFSLGALRRRARTPFKTIHTRAVVAQLLHGLAFLKDCQVVHGDIHAGNIMFRRSTRRLHHREESRQHQQEQSAAQEDAPVRATLKMDDDFSGNCRLPSCLPEYLVANPQVRKAPHQMRLDELEPVFVDLGAGCWLPAAPPCKSIVSPLQYRAPEAFFSRERVDCSLDVWTLAVTLYTIYTTETLFDIGRNEHAALIAAQILRLGCLPDHWWAEWKERLQFFSDSEARHFIGPDHLDTDSLEEAFSCADKRIAHMRNEPLGEGEGEDFVRMLRSMLAFEPEKRATPEQLLACDWMRKWGEPAMSGEHGEEVEREAAIDIDSMRSRGTGLDRIVF